MMEQYFEIKKEYKHCLLFFRLGDFYEMFYDDALTASKALDLTLTGRDCGQEERAPMCGVPYHAADSYISKLVQMGYKVAICEQTEDPKLTKTIVKRSVVRVVTSGTTLDTNALKEDKNNYIICLCENAGNFGLSACDVTTGEFFATEITGNNEKTLIDEIAKYQPSEIIVNHQFAHSKVLESVFNIKTYTFSEWSFDYGNAYVSLLNHFKVLNLHGFGLEDKKDAVSSSGALIAYLLENQKNSLKHILRIRHYQLTEYMVLDISSRRNLEITENVKERAKRGSLLWVLDKTKTPMGARLLRKWLEQPLKDAAKINKRLEAVEEFVKAPLGREELREYLNTVNDIERLIGRLSLMAANARDLASLKNSLLNMPFIKSSLEFAQAAFNAYMYKNFDDLADICALIEKNICDDPPFSVREGGFIKRGANAELDRLYNIKEQGADWILKIENTEREKTGIKNLKIKFNKIFGYCFEVTNSYKDMAPPYFVRRQTLANCERYTTEELKKAEEEILSADEKIKDLEYDLFCALCQNILAHTERIKKQAALVAAADCIAALADTADKMNYIKPEVTDGDVIDIRGGRHPVLESVMKQGFVANDTYLDGGDNRLSIITGPNMAGKSTYMRQTAIIVLMAQAGSFVPASYAKIGTVDRIFTRVGASDDLLSGQSTFMVEMSEVANILNNATSKSLLILDEIGRGTSTYDGLSIAWAVTEHIADTKKIGAKTLFATHYHELTELEGKIEGVNNYRVTVSQDGDDIVFLRKIDRGGAKSSYGIQVARLAGMPESVLKRSAKILGELNSADITKGKRAPKAAVNAEVVPDDGGGKNAAAYADDDGGKNEKTCAEDNGGKNAEVIKKILETDLNNVTPMQAFKILGEVQESLRS
ncbi:MAG: DNA mismatch repair protein MutS [Clostridiales bacterium]|jgi:DNA mismatch repair protein MutS|nr:DNA mismatch repair protein MutS [Clostridiales bacterium]